MASTSPEEQTTINITFRGADGNECEAFVVAIRDLAFAKGKEKDHHWMLHYATTRLRGKALRWHAKLDTSVQDNWYLFVQALFEEYPSVEEPEQGGITTPVWTSTTFSPALSSVTLPGNSDPQDASFADALHRPATEDAIRAPRISSQQVHPCPCASSVSSIPSPRVYDPSEPGLRVGRLRVVYQEGPSRTSQYVSRYECYPDYLNKITIDVQEALIVSFVSIPEPHKILCMEPQDSRSGRLGVKLLPVDLGEFHGIKCGYTYKQPVTMSSSPFRNDDTCHQRVSQIWNVLDDGTLQASLADLTRDPRNRERLTVSGAYVTTTVYVDMAGETISFAKDYSTPRMLHPRSQIPIVRGRVVFEPL